MSDKLSLGGSNTKYAQNARFVGRKAVTGPLNDLSLAHVVSELQAEARKNQSSNSVSASEELRCNLEFSDKHLLVTYIKKDEGIGQRSLLVPSNLFKNLKFFTFLCLKKSNISRKSQI